MYFGFYETFVYVYTFLIFFAWKLPKDFNLDEISVYRSLSTTNLRAYLDQTFPYETCSKYINHDLVFHISHRKNFHLDKRRFIFIKASYKFSQYVQG